MQVTFAKSNYKSQIELLNSIKMMEGSIIEENQLVVVASFPDEKNTKKRFFGTPIFGQTKDEGNTLINDKK